MELLAVLMQVALVVVVGDGRIEECGADTSGELLPGAAKFALHLLDLVLQEPDVAPHP